MKQFTVILLLVFTSAFLHGQNVNLGKGFSKDKKGQEELNIAEQLFEDGSFLLALPHYRSLESQYGDNPYLKYKVGICLLYKSDEVDKALEYLQAVKQKNAKAADIDFYVARAFHMNEKYDDALASLNLYVLNKKISPEQKEQAEHYIEYCNNAKEISATPIDVKITNIGDPVNTESSEYVPVITSDESLMLFTYVGEESRGGLQRLPGEPDSLGFYFEDIYLTEKKDGRWTQPVALDTGINSVGHDACIAISNDGQTLIVFKNSNEDLGDIYFSKLFGIRWTTPVRLEGDVNTPAWEGSASLSADEKIMFFASEREGGYGGRDIYIAELMPDGRWGKVKNMGPGINTKYDDDAPFIHPNGVTLIFSSQGHKSMGGYDIFRTDMNPDSSWSAPSNIGYPINTPGDDKYFVLSPDGKRGYYSSGKSGGKGQQDIYLAETDFDLKDANVVMLTGVVTVDDQPTQVKILVSADGKVIDSYGINSNAKTGRFLINLRQGKKYDITFLLDSLKQVRSLDAMRNNLGMVKEDWDIKLYSKGYKSKFQQMFEDSVRRADSIRMADEIRKNQLKTSTDVTTTTTTTVTPVNPPVTTTTTMIGGMNVTDYNSILSQYGSVKAEGLEFVVQVAAYRNPQNYRYSNLESLGKVERQELGDGVTRFVIGKFDNLKDADSFRSRVVQEGSGDAFVTAMYKGKRMLLKELAAVKFFQQ
ncbi:MAG: ompA [Bacteroidetes bacterium]|nr:MAG: ompA [Bacteroidota bacterium]